MEDVEMLEENQSRNSEPELITLLSLPFECLGQILTRLKSADLFRLRRVCQEVKEIIDKKIGLSFEIDDESAHGIQIITNFLPRIAVRSLTIKSLMMPLSLNFLINPDTLSDLNVRGNLSPHNCELIFSKCKSLRRISIHYTDEQSCGRFWKNYLVNSNYQINFSLQTLSIQIVSLTDELSVLEDIKNDVLPILKGLTCESLRTVKLMITISHFNVLQYEEAFLKLVDRHDNTLKNITICTSVSRNRHSEEQQVMTESTNIGWFGKLPRLSYLHLDVSHVASHWKQLMREIQGIRALNMSVRNAHWLLYKEIIANNAASLRVISIHGLSTLIQSGYRVPLDFCLFIKCIKLQHLFLSFLSAGLESHSSKRCLYLSNYQDAINADSLPLQLRHFRISHIKIHPVDLLSVLQRCQNLHSLHLTSWANSHLDFEDTLSLIVDVVKNQFSKLDQVVLKDSRHFFFKHRGVIRKLQQDLKDRVKISLEFIHCDLKMTLEFSRVSI